MRQFSQIHDAVMAMVIVKILLTITSHRLGLLCISFGQHSYGIHTAYSHVFTAYGGGTSVFSENTVLVIM